MLDPDTVIAASVRHASRLGTLMQGMAGAYLPAVALVFLVSALLVYAILVQSGIATVIAALGALAAVLVVIRKALSLTVGDTIEELRGGLWAAEIDGAVAQSILRLPPRAPVAPRPKLTLAKPPESQPGAMRTRDHPPRRAGAARDPQRSSPGLPRAGLGAADAAARFAAEQRQRQRHVGAVAIRDL